MNNTIKIDAAVLAAELAWITRGNAKFPTPILQAAEITTVLGGLRLRRTDYALWRETMIATEGAGQASVLVNPNKLAALLRGREQGFATVEVTDDGLTVVVGGATVKLRRAAANDDYPPWTAFEPAAKPARVGAAQLARALTSVCTDESLPMMTGVHFEDGTMVSTDRYQLTTVSYADKGFTALVPAAALRAFAGGFGVVSLEYEKPASKGAGVPAVRLSCEGHSIIARTLDDEFPKWRQLVPGDGALSVVSVLRREQLLSAIGEGVEVAITLRADTMTVCTADRDGDTVECEIATELLSGGADLPLTVRLNVRRLIGCLRGISGGLLRFGASTPNRPVLLRGADPDELHLLMTVKS